jgi:hypothetical protein
LSILLVFAYCTNIPVLKLRKYATSIVAALGVAWLVFLPYIRIPILMKKVNNLTTQTAPLEDTKKAPAANM